jgi:hypothetical protein
LLESAKDARTVILLEGTVLSFSASELIDAIAIESQRPADEEEWDDELEDEDDDWDDDLDDDLADEEEWDEYEDDFEEEDEPHHPKPSDW